MKQIVFLVMMVFAGAAFAQEKPPAKEEATKPEPMKEAAKPAPTKSAAARKAGRRWNEDARHCLEKGSNTEVIKCAEEYL
ncbi:MAG TPA: hypothetical protein VJ797_12150 [Burkholderiales bacterium]|nr:hypothetical protein [Burkholderiales bacterium]